MLRPNEVGPWTLHDGRRGAAAAASLILALFSFACSGDDAPAATAIPSAEVVRVAPSPSPTPSIEPITTLLFTGDIIPARCVYEEVQARGSDWTLPFQPLHDVLAGADITIGTLDATVSNIADPIGCIETFNLAGPAAAVDGLAYAGYDVISHAANHIKDCGQAGTCGDQSMFETETNLEAAGIDVAGTGANLFEARQPVVVERNGVYFAFLAYDDIAPYYQAGNDTAGSAPLDATTIAEDIANAKKVADVVIVLPHWGVEYTAEPNERQRAVAQVAADAGAALIAGNHPHVVQGHEQIGEAFVAYALGNFLFDQDWSLETQQGALLEVTFTGSRLTGWRYIPIRIHDRSQPRLAEGDEATQITGRIEAASIR